MATVKTYHHGDLRRELLNAARTTLKEKGVEALTMRTLGSSIGVSRTALYHHFRDKRALLCALAEEGFDQFCQLLEETLATMESERLSVRQHISRYIEFALNNKELYQLMFGGKFASRLQASSELREKSQLCFDQWCRMVALWRAQGAIGKRLSDKTCSLVMWCNLHGLVLLLIEEMIVDLVTKEEMIEGVASLFEVGGPSSTAVDIGADNSSNSSNT